MLHTHSQTNEAYIHRRLQPIVLTLLAMVLLVSTGTVVHAAEGEGVGRAWIERDFLHVETGDYHVRFWKKAAWTLASVNYQEQPILTHTGAYHSVLKAMEDGKSVWIGTGHGGEAIESLELIVDGFTRSLTEDMEPVTGSRFTLLKTSVLGPYHHTARVEVTADGIVEDFDYEMKGQPINLDRMYAFMHCFNNQTEQWRVGLPSGDEVEGVFTDDNSFTLKQDIRWAMVYAPAMGVGMTYAYPEIYEGHPPLKNAFWNRPTDNKLYLTVLPSQEEGAVFNYTVRLQGFAAPEEKWEAAGRAALMTLIESSEQ